MRIAIIGGGIGGLTTALALQQRGIEGQVYEAAPALEPVGAGIGMSVNAMRVFARLEVAQAVREAGVVLENARILTRDGTVLQHVDLRGSEAAFGQPNVALHRGRLQAVLADAVRSEALHLGKRAVRFAVSGQTVTVHFEDGTSAEADALVGADGLRSVVRQQLFPKAALRHAGQTCYRGVADVGKPAELREIWDGAHRFGFVPIGPEETYWFAPITLAAAPDPQSSLASVRQELMVRYADFPASAQALLAATDPADLIRTDLLDLPPMERWHRGRVTLLGDAAHAATPNLGQGGAQAVEDAWVLAEQLDRGETPEAAFAAYEDLRMKKAHQIVRRSYWFGRMAHWQHGAARRLRDGLMRAVPAFVQKRQVEQLYRLGY